MIEQALIMTVMGMTVVFLVLGINSLLIWSIGKLFGSTPNAAPAAARAPSGQDAVPKQKLVAAAMAAVRLYEEETNATKS